MIGDAAAPLLEWLRQQGVEFRLPAVLLALLLVPALAVWYVGARQTRRHVARAFRVASYRPRRTWRGAARGFATTLLWLGLAGTVVGFARPVVELPTPEDRATVVLVMDASLAMRATDVRPVRLEAAKSAAKAAVNAVPERAQLALVGYSSGAYVLHPPTHDHGAIPAAFGRLRTADGAAVGEALYVALGVIPVKEEAEGAPPRQGPSPKVPSAIVLVSTGDYTGGRDLAEAAAMAREAGVPVHVVGIGPRQGAELKAPYDERLLRQVAQATGGQYLAAGSTREWRQVMERLGSDVKVDVREQEVGHFAGAAGLATMGVAMLVMLAAMRRLV
jgi:Ca-activated chloride channel homolog